MTFMDSLAQNPNINPGVSNSGVYGMPGQTSDSDVLSLVNQLKDREMRDFKDKANFMSDLSLNQEQRMRNLWDPNKTNLANRTTVQAGEAPGQPNPESLAMNPMPGMTTKDKLDYGLKQQELVQKGKFGQEALDVKSQQEKLNQQKSDQINAQKQADMQRKIEESNQKIELAQQKLQQAGDNAQAQLAAHK